MMLSIVIRTYNEEKHLASLLESIRSQRVEDNELEVVVVDSGSTDRTISIAEKHECRLVHISKDEFTFGRSLNIGCHAAKGDILVFISGHCIPVCEDWLMSLTSPIIEGKVTYIYGRQVGNHTSKYSECQLLKKYYPEKSNIPQEGFFCNNANAALLRSAWEQEKFDETLTGLEDMELGKRLTKKGINLGYVAGAPVYHLHNEAWHKVRIRYERESFALQHIMPQIHIGKIDMLRYFLSAVLLDCGSAAQEKMFLNKFVEIVMFRMMQYWGTYRGNHEHRELSRKMKEEYFYPK